MFQGIYVGVAVSMHFANLRELLRMELKARASLPLYGTKTGAYLGPQVGPLTVPGAT